MRSLGNPHKNDVVQSKARRFLVKDEKKDNRCAVLGAVSHVP